MLYKQIIHPCPHFSQEIYLENVKTFHFPKILTKPLPLAYTSSKMWWFRAQAEGLGKFTHTMPRFFDDEKQPTWDPW